MYTNQRQRPYNHYMHHAPAPNNSLRNQHLNRAPKRNNVQEIVQRFVNPDSVARGAGGLTKTLTGVQQVLKVVQSATPIVQQYGPMVKNLPAMYRMVKAFKEVNNMDDTDTDNNTNRNEPMREVDPTSMSENIQRYNGGESTPKLYI